MKMIFSVSCAKIDLQFPNLLLSAILALSGIALPATNAAAQTRVPASPSALKAKALSPNAINLTWTNKTTNATGFKIEQKTGSRGKYVQIATAGATATSFKDVTVAGGTTYSYRVRATNSAGASAFSKQARVTTPAAPAIKPWITSHGYDTILNLKITGTPGDWRLSDAATQTLPPGYEWWYFVGSKIIKTSSNLTNEPWKGNHPGRVLKMGGKLGLDTFNRWSPGGGYYDNDAGMWFEHGDAGGSTSFMFK